jgi:hypothetical protein
VLTVIDCSYPSSKSQVTVINSRTAYIENIELINLYPRVLLLDCLAGAVDFFSYNPHLVTPTMTVCNHASWMSDHGEDQRLFQHSSVLSDITRNLQVPTQKWPSLVVMIADSSTHTLLSQAMPKTRKLVDNGSRNSLCVRRRWFPSTSQLVSFCTNLAYSAQISAVSIALQYNQFVSKLPPFITHPKQQRHPRERARYLMSITASRDARCNGTGSLLEARIVYNALVYRQ